MGKRYVRSVDLHPTKPWILSSLYSGTVRICNYQSQTMVMYFTVTESPVRSTKFIARKQWVVAGADDQCIHVYNYITLDKVKMFKAHANRIRCVAVHPTLPYVLSSSDDMLIKLWDWEKGWICTQIFEEHSHYVMQVTFNPKNTNTFASVSLDCTIKIWNLGLSNSKFTLDAHQKGVNCVDYFTGGDKPYLITGSNDHTAKVWDYETKSCVQTLKGHTDNVSAVCFHPELPLIITGSNDGTVCIWHATTYRLQDRLNYGAKMVWTIGYMKGSCRVVIGHDKGTIMVNLGCEVAGASMDNSGKIIWAKHDKFQTVNIKSVGADFEAVNGERLPLAVKELGTCDLYPHSLKHNPDGTFIVVCGDGKYIIYTALEWRARSFGLALEFVWSSDGEYAVRESTSKIKIFSKNFQKKKSVRPTFSAEHIYGGTLLAMCSNDFICFYDWAECRLIQQINFNVKNLYWADSGYLVAIASDTSFYILKYNCNVVSSYLDSGRPVDEQCAEDAFELLHTINECVRTGLWVGDCFIYSNNSWRLNYCIGGEVTTMFHLDQPMYLLGYLAIQGRVYLIDKEFNVMGYTLPLSLVENNTLVMRGDLDRANEVLTSIPKEHHTSVARFLESCGLIEEALEVATDPDYRFELAIRLGRLEVAKEIATKVQSEFKWKRLGELAVSTGKLEMAEECLKYAMESSGLLALYSSLDHAKGITKLANLAKEQGKNNVYWKNDFNCVERFQGTSVNILEGLELHTGVFNPEEQKKIVDYVYTLQDKGEKGEFKARTYTAPRKWKRGKGRVTIQFGCCYNFALDKNGNPPGILCNEMVDPMPDPFKVIIERLVSEHVLPPTCVPDSSIVNIYDEGDCIPPHIDSHDFVRPFCSVSFLSECNIVFGSKIKIVGDGEFVGSIAVPLPVGSVLVFNGNGADVAQHCVPAVPTKRISITFRRMDESKRPFGYEPEPFSKDIQLHDVGKTKRINSHSPKAEQHALKRQHPIPNTRVGNKYRRDSGRRIRPRLA